MGGGLSAICTTPAESNSNSRQMRSPIFDEVLRACPKMERDRMKLFGLIIGSYIRLGITIDAEVVEECIKLSYAIVEYFDE